MEGHPKMGRQAKDIIDALDSQLVLPLIALIEAMFVIEKGRTSLPSAPQFFERIQQDKRIEIYEVTLEIFQRSLQPDAQKIPELHDRLIVSTGLYLQDLGHEVAILTKDTKIIQADVLPVIW
jgi:PIN domain nuclease of toxin-antitoxin system